MERASRGARSAGRNPRSARFILLATLITVFVLSTTVVSAETITKEYSWTHQETGPPRNVSFELAVEVEYLDGYRAYPVKDRFDYGSMITVSDPFVMVAALELRAIAVQYGLDQAALALSFVQTLEYKEDNVTTNCVDYARFPLESLVDWVGDCEDKALLYTTLLIDLGYEAVLFVMYDNDSGHMATGVAGPGFTGGSIEHEGTDYYYAETTSKGFEIGEVPNDIDLGDIEVVERSEPKGPYDPPVEEETGIEPIYYLLMGVLFASAIAMIVAAIGSSRRRKAEESAKQTEETWNTYERLNERMDDRTGSNVIDEPRGPVRQRRPPRGRSRPPAHPPEQWRYGEDRRRDRREEGPEEDEQTNPYNPYR